MQGKCIFVDIDITASVTQLKAKIQEKTQIPAHCQLLKIFGTYKPLVDHNHLSDYNIGNGATLDLGMRMNADGSSPLVDWRTPFNLYVFCMSESYPF